MATSACRGFASRNTTVGHKVEGGRLSNQHRADSILMVIRERLFDQPAVEGNAWLRAFGSRDDVPGSVLVVKEREEFLQFFAIWLAAVFTHFIGFGVFDRFAGFLPIPRDEGSAILVCDPALAA